MSDRGRLLLFLLAAPVFGGLLLWGFGGLPPFGGCGTALLSRPEVADGSGEPSHIYGDVINAVAVGERHLTNMATAINFDYRGFDTLGEEYILFTSLVGLALLLRRYRGEVGTGPRDFLPQRNVPHRNEAMRWLGLILIALTNLFGLYIVAHAQLTPGGGFQGGAILGTAALLVYLARGYPEFRAVTPKRLADVADALGAGAYALIGLGTLLAGGAFLANTLPLGQTGTLFSAGTIPVINAAVGLEVAGGFSLLFVEFLADTRKPVEKKS